MARSKIILENIQIKNLVKARKLCRAINIIEEECGIKNVEIVLKNVFICEWIDKSKLNNTEMECLIRDIIK